MIIIAFHAMEISQTSYCTKNDKAYIDFTAISHFICTCIAFTIPPNSMCVHRNLKHAYI